MGGVEELGLAGILFERGRWDRTELGGIGRFVRFRIAHLQSGESVSLGPDSMERALVPLSGTAVVEVEESLFAIGGRGDVFEGPTSFLYVPRDTYALISAESGLELAICAAECECRHEIKLVEPADQSSEIRGSGSATRHISTLIGSDFPADRLFVVEVWTPSGNWSSYPPHKHDEATNDEGVLEETYYYRFAKSNGFALQRLYSPSHGFDATFAVHHGDLCIFPWGYHTTCVAPGYDLYYLNVLAGPESGHAMRVHEDPDHEWQRRTWAKTRPDPGVPFAFVSTGSRTK